MIGRGLRVFLVSAWTAASVTVPSSAKADQAAARNANSASAEGRALFEGRTPLPARMPGHSQDLPAYASRCANCHRPQPVPRSAAAPAPLAPRLDAELLTQSRSRRRGPASRYDTASFCELLRTGVDPAGVMIEQSMPRFAISDEQCRSLWTHLVGSVKR